MSSSPGTFVNFFSSPDLEFGGFPLGIAGDGCPPTAADNVRSLNEAAPTVAMFRPTMVPLPLPGDLDGDGVVGVADLLIVILNWGPCPAPPASCPGDATGDGEVGVEDLVEVLMHWGGRAA